MTPQARTDDTLATLEKRFREKVYQVLDAMMAIGWEMVAYDGKRTTLRQQQLYAQGRTKPGKIVTHLDGVTKRSKHQDGLAVDCAWVVWKDDGSWDVRWDGGPWDAYMACAEALGLTCGGKWRLRDLPHLEQR